MAEKKDPQKREPQQPVEGSPFDRFHSLTRRLLHVSKDDLREAEAEVRDQEKRRTA